jgi:hypothetical protein
MLSSMLILESRSLVEFELIVVEALLPTLK